MPTELRDSPNPRGGYARPDHDQQKLDPTMICKACKRRGHPASQCDLLAQAIFLTKYMKHSLTDLARGKLEEAWLKCWKEKWATLIVLRERCCGHSLIQWIFLSMKWINKCAGTVGLQMMMWKSFPSCLKNDVQTVPMQPPACCLLRSSCARMHNQGIPHRLSLTTQHASPPLGFSVPMS